MSRKSSMELALDLLNRRAYVEKKLMQRLLESGYSTGEINETMERLRGWGYLNDREFGRNRIIALQSRLKSRAFVENDLCEIGLESKLVIELMDDYYPELHEIQIARRLLLRKSRNQQRNKAWGPAFLIRSGFSENTVQQCFPEVSST